MVRLVAPRQPPQPIERPRWHLVREGRYAQAVAREVPGVGHERVITIDDELR